jgi:hypothetical protein
MPHELAIGDVYLPPLLVAAVLGSVFALVATRALNRYRFSRYFFYPPLVQLALAVIFTVIVGTVFIRT